MKLNRKWLLIIGLVLSLTMATAGTLAYLTDTETAENVFTLGKVDIELTEPSWDPDEDYMLMPGIEIPKDPKVQNIGNTDAWVWLEVSIPEELYDLVNLDYQSPWQKGYVNTSGSDKVVTLKWPEKLAPTDFTKEAFTRVLLNSAVDNEDLGTLSGVKSKIVVKGYAIQGTFNSFADAYDAYYNGNGHEPSGTPAQDADALKNQLAAGGKIVYTGSDDVVIDQDLTLTGDTTLHLSNTDLKFEDGAKIVTNGHDLTITDAKIVGGGETAFEVNGDSVVTLGEGTTIEQATEVDTSLFNAYSYTTGETSKIVLDGAKITNNNNGGKGVIFHVGYGSELIIEEGTVISGNTVTGKTSNGNPYALITVASGGTVTMTGGKITDNTFDNRALISIEGGKFVMNGGEISGNEYTGTTGYALIRVATSASVFEMNGGEISGNTIAGNDCSVLNNRGTTKINGGSITGNNVQYTIYNGGSGTATVDFANANVDTNNYGVN